MSVISANLGDEHLAKADAIASILSESYGVPVSRSHPPRDRRLPHADATWLASCSPPKKARC